MPFTRKAPTIYPDTQSPFTAFQKGYEDESNKIARKEKEKKLEERQKTLWDREDTLWNQSQDTYYRKLTKEQKAEQVSQYVRAIAGKLLNPQMNQSPQMMESQEEMSPRPTGIMGSERAMSPLARQTDGELASEGQNLRREPAQQLNNQQASRIFDGDQINQLLGTIPLDMREAVMKGLVEGFETEEKWNETLKGAEDDSKAAFIDEIDNNPEYTARKIELDDRHREWERDKNGGKESESDLRARREAWEKDYETLADDFSRALYNNGNGLPAGEVREFREGFIKENIQPTPQDDISFIDNKLNEMGINWSKVLSSNDREGVLKVVESVGEELRAQGADTNNINEWIQKQGDSLITTMNKRDKTLTSEGKGHAVTGGKGFQVYSDNSGNNYIEFAPRDVKTPNPYSLEVNLGSDFPNSNGKNLSINFTDIPQYHRQNIDEKEEQLRGGKLLYETFKVDVPSKLALANIINNADTSGTGKVKIRDIEIEIENRSSEGSINPEEKANMLRVLDDVVRFIDDGGNGEKTADLNMRNVFQSLKYDMDSLTGLAGGRLLQAVVGAGGLAGGGGVPVSQVKDKYTAQSIIQGVKSFAQGLITSQVPINEEQLLAYNVSSDIKLIRQLYGATIDGFKGAVRNAINLPHLRKQGIDLSNKMGFEAYPVFVDEVLDRKAAPYISQYYKKEDFKGDGKKSNAKESDSAPKRSSASGMK